MTVTDLLRKHLLDSLGYAPPRRRGKPTRPADRTGDRGFGEGSEGAAQAGAVYLEGGSGKTGKDVTMNDPLRDYEAGSRSNATIAAIASALRSARRLIADLESQVRQPNPARDIVNECNDLLAAKDAEIERLRAGLRGIRREFGHMSINNGTSTLGLFIDMLVNNDVEAAKALEAAEADRKLDPWEPTNPYYRDRARKDEP